MKLAVMQPYFMPYIGYFQLINAVDRFVILDDVNYINKGWINRNRILINGKDGLFTIPLKGSSQNRLICEIEIADIDNWKSKLLRTIYYNYSKAPYFREIFPLVENIVLCSEKSITAYNYNSICIVNQYLTIGTEIIPSSKVYKNNNLRGQERILDICQKEEATVYINAANGFRLYSKREFANNNIELLFIIPEIMEYSQFNKEFIPGLSIIDVLMFNPVSVIQEYLNNFKLN